MIQLANLADIASVYQPDTIKTVKAHASSLRVEEYAIVALRLLGTAGPAGWWHKAWLEWSEKQPELLERLTQHALELNYLLTPTALPDTYGPNQEKQIRIGKDWQQKGRRNPESCRHNFYRPAIWRDFRTPISTGRCCNPKATLPTHPGRKYGIESCERR